MGNVQKRLIRRQRLGIMAVRGWGNDYSWKRGFSWNLIVNLIAQLLNMLETTRLHTSKRLILWYVNFTSIFKTRMRNSVMLAGTIQLSKLIEKMGIYWPENILNITIKWGQGGQKNQHFDSLVTKWVLHIHKDICMEKPWTILWIRIREVYTWCGLLHRVLKQKKNITRKLVKSKPSL